MSETIAPLVALSCNMIAPQLKIIGYNTATMSIFKFLFSGVIRGSKVRDLDKLLNTSRFRDTTKKEGDKRIEFERDYDRIIYTSGFRRLQDKAQVFPLERKDFVRTRLTHSLEVSTLARSLGVDTARTLLKNGKLTNEYDREFGNILSSIALIHDLGNPPFGHFGEDTIGTWFEEFFNLNKGIIEEKKKKDFTKFEGNAQTFRILTRLQFLKDDFGLNLTFGTLSALLKYPIRSDKVGKKGSTFKKYGYFFSEEDRFDQLNSEVGLFGKRHPLTYLLEAADDIAYSVADVEDGFKKDALGWDELISILESKLPADSAGLLDTLINNEASLKKIGYPESKLNAIQIFRIEAQGKMLRDSVEVFVNNFDEILSGAYTGDILSKSNSADLCEMFKNEIGIRKVYSCDEVLTQEIVSEKVIKGLLSMHVEAMLGDDYLDTRKIQGKLYSQISSNFKYYFENKTERSNYDKFRLVTDYISGMTDSFALHLYQKYNGIL
ncbi:dNTP triphosphohydrolase [Geomonas nitrogeniifigens]|uniref:DNTP triphosphohydrolase n=1 Tax=Geomonas diazotrophica TaxID=2843197 RepID=A0ABX8JHA4_9BACT|nr:dNTP triphosphohydrolase [Geomonas nitrogeniifigens]QWV97759.1 dNTP triphosphohydrolase [Geomonas nitrogeniifigens]